MTAREQVTCATCDLMDDGLPCEYHRGWRDGAEAGWDERGAARAQYLGPESGHYKDCMGWNDCDCARYPNPYRAALTGADQ